jgi:hypothetical protein
METPNLVINSQNYNQIQIKTLSQLNYKYTDNVYADYGLSDIFQLFTPASASQFANYIRTLYDSRFERRTARTSMCIRDHLGLQKAIFAIKKELEEIASKLVGLPMKLQLPIDYAHINVQKSCQTKPVDDWHFDSTPFVLVTILTDHINDPGANLLVSHKNDDKIFKCKLQTPGQACLMQGNQIYHCAQQSLTSERISMVTSFYVDSPFIYDCSSLKAPIEYSDYATCVQQYANHFMTRIVKSCQALISTNAEYNQRNKVIYMEVAKLSRECEILLRAAQHTDNYQRIIMLNDRLSFVLTNRISQDTILKLKHMTQSMMNPSRL